MEFIDLGNKRDRNEGKLRDKDQQKSLSDLNLKLREVLFYYFIIINILFYYYYLFYFNYFFVIIKIYNKEK